MADPRNELVRWNNATMLDAAKEQAIVGALKGYTKRIAALIGDQSVDVSQLMASVVLAVAKNDYLLKCDPTSLILAVLQGAREGITSFSGPYAGGYLVPFKDKVTLVHNYKFLLDGARVSVAIQGLRWGVVREVDAFDYRDGTAPVLEYKKLLKGGRGELICSWAVVTLPSGSQRIDVCEYEYLTRIAEDSLAKITREDAKQYSPWIQWPDEMFTKTQIRHALKTCGLNFDRHARLVNLMENDDRAMSGDVAKEFESVHRQTAQTQGTSAVSALRARAQQHSAVNGRAEEQNNDGNSDDNGDPLAPLMDQLSQAPNVDAVMAVQKAWLKNADESIQGEIKAMCAARIKAIAG